MIGSMLSLGVRRNLGNIPALPVNFLLEHGLNEPYLGDLRNDEEYDPYKHALIFNQIGKADQKDSYGLNLKTLLRVFAGPYGPYLKHFYVQEISPQELHLKDFQKNEQKKN